jgi:uncharacterized delta-60 repeat protein
MAIESIGSFAAANNKIAGTTFSFTSSGDIGTGSLAVLFVGADNLTTATASNSITSVTDNSIAYNFQQGTGFNDIAYSIVTQSDGKILVGGAFTSYNDQDAPSIARLNTDGTLDTSFNPYYREIDGTIFKLAIQPDITGSYYSGSGVWSTGGTLSNGRYRLAGAGTQNAGLAFGGFNGVSILSATEEYNGTSWTAGGALITARNSLAGAGTQNAGLAFGGGSGYSCTEEYNGASWSVGGTLIDARSLLAGAGTQNAGLAFGGSIFTGFTEEYNGASWSVGGVMITARFTLAGAGTQNAALAFGGSPQPVVLSCTEEYDGSSWLSGGTLITARCSLAGAGTQNAALAFGGGVPAARACTEEYDGTSWSAGGALSTARYNLAGAGTQNAGLAFGGFPDTSCTEEYTVTTTTTCISDKIIAVGTLTRGAVRLNPDGTVDPSFNIGTGFNSTVCTVIVQETGNYTAGGTTYTNKLILGGTFTSYSGSTSSGSVRLSGNGTIDSTFTAGDISPVDVRCYQFYGAGVWTAGGALITARAYLAGAGTQNEALAFGGFTDISAVTCTEEYNGTSWANGGALITARNCLAGAGTQNEALAVGGVTSTTPCSNTEEYNGTSWTNGGNLINARRNLAGAGAQNAGLVFGGVDIGATSQATEEYNGTSWSAGGNLITGRTNLAGTGTQNAGLAFGGNYFLHITCTEEYNGTSWSAGGALITGRYDLAGAGTQNAALAFGGFTPSPFASTRSTERYNGTSWSTGNNLSNSLYGLAGAGVQSAALAFGGKTGAPAFTIGACTEEFNSGLLTVGNFTSVSGSNRPRIALLNATNGNLIATSSFNIGNAGFNAAVNSIAVLPDNSIVAVGAFTQYSGSNNNRLVKINTDGTLNTAFSASIGTGLNDTGNVVYFYPDTGIGGAWSIGGALIAARNANGGAGSQNEALAMGGLPANPAGGLSEEYNGVSWSAGGNLITARYATAGAGTQNAALVVGGRNASNVDQTSAEEYDGSTWASGGSMIVAKVTLSATGTQNSALAMGGLTPAGQCTEEYDGTTWTTGGAIINSRGYSAAAGTQNEALIFGGRSPSSPVDIIQAEEYNGTSWSAGGDIITPRIYLAGAGTQNAALSAGGSDISDVYLTCVELYDGSAWSSTNGLLTARNALAGAGIQNEALAFGGRDAVTTQFTCTEEYSTGDRILIGGAFTTFRGLTYNGSVRVFQSDGSVDSSFNIGSGFDSAVDVDDFLIIDDVNNGIIAVGGFTSYSGSFNPSPNRIVKLNANGSIDASSTGNTWTKLAERGTGDNAGAGSTVAMFYASPTSSIIYSGTTLTATFAGSITANAASGWLFGTTINLSPITGVLDSSNAGGTSDPPAMTIDNLTGSNEYLFIRGIAYENTPSLTFTPTTDFTAIDTAGTTGGAALTNQTVVGEFRIISTSSLTSDPSLSTATSNANIYYVFYENDAVSGARTYFILIN